MRRIVITAAVGLLSLAATAGGAAASHRIDLASGNLDGHAVLGSTIPRVVAELGQPDFQVGGGRSLRRIGWGTPGDFSLELVFRRTGGKLRAQTLVFERGPVIDAKAGNLLAKPSRDLQSTIQARYDGAFDLVRPLACNRSQCTGEFASTAGALHMTFGSTRTRGTFVSIWQAAK